jgi:hypothetical protein
MAAGVGSICSCLIRFWLSVVFSTTKVEKWELVCRTEDFPGITGLETVCIIVPHLNLKAAVGREKAVQAIDVAREWNHCVVTFWVMSQLFHFLGASRGCADFRDPTAVFRLNLSLAILINQMCQSLARHKESLYLGYTEEPA